MKKYFVYMLRCRDGSLYTGYTVDVQARIETHAQGRGAKYTRSRRPVTLAYAEALPDKTAALKREAQIKKLPKCEKEAMAAAFLGKTGKQQAE